MGQFGHQLTEDSFGAACTHVNKVEVVRAVVGEVCAPEYIGYIDGSEELLGELIHGLRVMQDGCQCVNGYIHTYKDTNFMEIVPVFGQNFIIFALSYDTVPS